MKIQVFLKRHFVQTGKYLPTFWRIVKPSSLGSSNSRAGRHGLTWSKIWIFSKIAWEPQLPLHVSSSQNFPECC